MIVWNLLFVLAMVGLILYLFKQHKNNYPE